MNVWLIVVVLTVVTLIIMVTIAVMVYYSGGTPSTPPSPQPPTISMFNVPTAPMGDNIVSLYDARKVSLDVGIPKTITSMPMKYRGRGGRLIISKVPIESVDSIIKEGDTSTYIIREVAEVTDLRLPITWRYQTLHIILVN